MGINWHKIMVQAAFFAFMCLIMALVVFSAVSIAHSLSEENKLRMINGRYDALHEQYPRLTPSLYNHICRESVKFGVDPVAVVAIIDVETGGSWSRFAVSRAGAAGLMQLMPDTARDLGVDNRFDERENISGGVKHFAFCLGRAGNDYALAFRYYNGGHNRRIFPAESIRYSELCMSKIDRSAVALL